MIRQDCGLLGTPVPETPKVADRYCRDRQPLGVPVLRQMLYAELEMPSLVVEF